MIPELVATGIQLIRTHRCYIKYDTANNFYRHAVSWRVSDWYIESSSTTFDCRSNTCKTVIEGIKVCFLDCRSRERFGKRTLGWHNKLKNWILRKVRGFAESIIDGIKEYLESGPHLQ